jgi:hypothetical protein
MWCWQRIRTGSVNDSVALLEMVHLQDPLELAPWNQWMLAAWYQMEEASDDGTPVEYR